jgi:hypothetical protein
MAAKAWLPEGRDAGDPLVACRKSIPSRRKFALSGRSPEGNPKHGIGFRQPEGAAIIAPG